MINVAVKCGCTRLMSTDGSAGRNAFRCGCGARIRINEQAAPVRRCSYGDCRTVAVTKEPLRFCLEHEKAAASLLGPMAGTLEVELFLNSSATTRYRRFGGLGSSKERGKHPSLVYFMRRERLIKIGHSTNVRVRAQALGAVVLATTPGARDVEEQHHDRFAQLHAFDEWFRPGAELVGYINSLRRMYGRAILF